ncbi:transposase [Spongiibacter tropicus]|uniref:transposase n=1 Tax=Spongiibacter tropicus TaxID=454602 RepID=UPI0003B4F82E|nr:transposase [Spongiibacter tropicus]
MARPLRIEFAGALYHLTARGNGRGDIYLDDSDRVLFLEVLAGVCERYNWLCHAYCLMGNHYHLLVETPDAHLSQGMRQLNGVYTQRFNRRHKRVGHVFQGRYKAILVQANSYLLELSRYIVLSPVRARMVTFARDWPWSSYRATAGLVPAPPWLAVDWILTACGSRKSAAQKAYQSFVSKGKRQSSPWSSLKNQIYLGSESFVEQMQQLIEADKDLSEIPVSQRRAVPKPLDWYANHAGDRDDAIRLAYNSGGYRMREIGCFFGWHYSRVSKILKSGERGKT